MPAKETYSPTRFLMVEDDDDHAELIIRSFASCPCKYQLSRASDGEQAVNILENRNGSNENPPDVVLLDLNIPRLSGFKVLDLVKSSPILKGIVVIIFTTSNSNKDRELAYDLGVNSYVVKPVGFEAFETAITYIKFYWGKTNTPRNMKMEAKR